MGDGDESDVCRFASASEVFVKFRNLWIASECAYGSHEKGISNALPPSTNMSSKSHFSAIMSHRSQSNQFFAIWRFSNFPSSGREAIKIAAVCSPIPFSEISNSLIFPACLSKISRISTSIFFISSFKNVKYGSLCSELSSLLAFFRDVTFLPSLLPLIRLGALLTLLNQNDILLSFPESRDSFSLHIPIASARLSYPFLLNLDNFSQNS